MKDEHVKDAAQNVAEDVLGAAVNGGVKMFIVARVIFQRRNPRPKHAFCPPRCPWATRKAEHVKDAAQNVVEDVAQDVA